MMTIYKETGSRTHVPQDFHCLPTDDLSEEQLERERQKDDARRAAFTAERRAKEATRKRTVGKSPKRRIRKPAIRKVTTRRPRKPSADKSHLPTMGTPEKKMSLSFAEKDRNKPRVTVMPIQFFEDMTRDRARKGNRARR